jgi:hypothetical protein
VHLGRATGTPLGTIARRIGYKAATTTIVIFGRDPLDTPEKGVLVVLTLRHGQRVHESRGKKTSNVDASVTCDETRSESVTHVYDLPSFSDMFLFVVASGEEHALYVTAIR